MICCSFGPKPAFCMPTTPLTEVRVIIEHKRHILKAFISTSTKVVLAFGIIYPFLYRCAFSANKMKTEFLEDPSTFQKGDMSKRATGQQDFDWSLTSEPHLTRQKQILKDVSNVSQVSAWCTAFGCHCGCIHPFRRQIFQSSAHCIFCYLPSFYLSIPMPFRFTQLEGLPRWS